MQLLLEVKKKVNTYYVIKLIETARLDNLRIKKKNRDIPERLTFSLITVFLCLNYKGNFLSNLLGFPHEDNTLEVFYLRLLKFRVRLYIDSLPANWH
jgi:hypothetical protein